MKQARDDVERERRAKESRRDQMMEYRRQLEELMEKEREDTAEQDRLIEEQNRLQQEKQDARRRAEEEARAALMRDVVETRAQQLQASMASVTYRPCGTRHSAADAMPGRDARA